MNAIGGSEGPAALKSGFWLGNHAHKRPPLIAPELEIGPVPHRRLDLLQQQPRRNVSVIAGIL
jgi:hypothetical protein